MTHDDLLLPSVIDRIENNLVVDEHFPEGGRLHIDHQQPFLCIYRKPPARQDAGTGELVTAQASFVLSAGESPTYDPIRYIDQISASLVKAFGAFLLFELWTTEERQEPAQESRRVQRLSFTLYAPMDCVPEATLEALERSLLEVDWPGGTPEIIIHYKEQIAPKDLEPLLTSATEAVTWLGMEIDPNYQIPGGADFYPDLLRRIRRNMTNAIRKMAYEFAHSHTKFRPRHFHELGRQNIEPIAFAVDRRLAEIDDKFDLLLHMTPVNVEQEWIAFQECDFKRTPEFHYRPLGINPVELKKVLFSIPYELVEDPAMHQLFADKRDEIDKQLTLMLARGNKPTFYDSLSLYGAPREDLLAQAKELAQRTKESDPSVLEGRSIGADELASLAGRELGHYRKRLPDMPSTVEVRDDVTGLIVVDGNLLIGRSVAVDQARSEAAVQHEVGTHILTFLNGLQQPFQLLHSGSAGYEDLQEGLAVFAEFMVGGLTAGRIHQLACRVIAIDCARRGADFIETFDELRGTYNLADRTAFIMTMRLFRGGGFAKDVVYLRGFIELLDRIRDGLNIQSLYLGKIGWKDLPLIEELNWRNITRSPALWPRFLQTDAARRRLNQIRTGNGIDQLIEG